MTLSIRPVREGDLDACDRIFRLAFGTFLAMPDPLQFAGDTDYVRTRWRATPESALGAEQGGEIVGSNFATRWGTFGFFGPITVRPDLWERGVAKRLLEPTMEIFRRWGTTHQGLFTFSHSPKHHALYQKFGFYPRFLTSVASKSVAAAAGERAASFAALGAAERDAALAGCREVTESLYEGLDLASEILATDAQKLGDTLLLADGGRLEGFAVCHVGAGTEAGSGVCYVKFGAVRSGPRAERSFSRLLDACESFAASRGAKRLLAGVNLARERAYRELSARGFRAEIVGVAMQSRNEPAYNRPEVMALDDWR